MAGRVLSRPHLLRLLPSPMVTQIASASPPRSRKIQSCSPNPRDPPDSFARSHVAVAALLQRYGYPQSQLRDFIQKNHRLLSASPPRDIESSIQLLLSFGLTQNSLLSILSHCPRALDFKFVDQWRSALSELGSSPSISAALEHSGRFRIEPEDFHRNALTMKKNLNFSDETVMKVFEEMPAAFMEDPVDVGRRVDVLLNFGIKQSEIDRICCKFPLFLAFGVETRLKPLFQEFKDLGFSQSEVGRALWDDPKLVLGMEGGEASRCWELIASLKCRAAIKEKMLYNGRLRAVIRVKQRIDFLCSHGLIRRDAFKVLYVEPRTILYELEDIEEKIEFLVEKMGFGVEHLVQYPEYLGVNLEKHIVPRLAVVRHLESVGGVCFPVGLKHLVRLSRVKFYNLYVKPYPECEEIFGGVVRERKDSDHRRRRPKHPPGLWKMFLPEKKFGDSREDVRNMKLFMESLV